MGVESRHYAYVSNAWKADTSIYITSRFKDLPLMGVEGFALLVGSLAAAGVGLFAHAVGYDRDRAFYATVLTVVGMLYVLFAVMAGGRGLLPEIAFFAAFAALAAIGFRWSMWIVAAGLVLHGLFDFIRYSVLVAPGAPSWWPEFCGSYDVVAALALSALLLARRPDHPARTA